MISVIWSMFGARLRDLRPQAIRHAHDRAMMERASHGAQAMRRMASGIGRKDGTEGQYLEVIFADAWTSPLIHKLIFLPRMRERLRLRFAPEAAGPADGTPSDQWPATQLTLIDRPWADYGHQFVPGRGWMGIHPESSTKPAAAARRFFGDIGAASPSAGALLAESLWFYMSLPHALARQAFVVSLGITPTVAGHREVLFCAAHGGNPTPESDQFLVWLDPETARPTHVQYTFRRLMTSYAGCIEYKDWKEIEPGWWWPMRQLIGTHAGRGATYHTMTIEDVERSRN